MYTCEQEAIGKGKKKNGKYISGKEENIKREKGVSGLNKERRK